MFSRFEWEVTDRSKPKRFSARSSHRHVTSHDRSRLSEHHHQMIALRSGTKTEQRGSVCDRRHRCSETFRSTSEVQKIIDGDEIRHAFGCRAEDGSCPIQSRARMRPLHGDAGCGRSQGLDIPCPGSCGRTDSMSTPSGWPRSRRRRPIARVFRALPPNRAGRVGPDEAVPGFQAGSPPSAIHPASEDGRSSAPFTGHAGHSRVGPRCSASTPAVSRAAPVPGASIDYNLSESTLGINSSPE